MPLSFRPLSHALGAEVQGVDLSQPLGNSEFDQIHRTFLERGILLFRDQKITREQHIAFSRRFGELDRHDSLPRDRHPDYPELLLVTNIPEPDGKPSASKYTGHLWHSDMSFTPVPSLGSLLRGITIPSVGGDTMFTNMYRAYDTLSDGMKKMIEGLHGIHTGTRKVDDPNSTREQEQRKINPPIAQPVVRVHPETGRKALYIGEKVSCFVGMTPEESQPLIDYLIKHATRPQFVYRHQWAPGRHRAVGQPLHHARGAGRLRGGRDPPPRTHHGQGHAVRILLAMKRAHFLKGLGGLALATPSIVRAPGKDI